MSDDSVERFGYSSVGIQSLIDAKIGAAITIAVIVAKLIIASDFLSIFMIKI